MIANFINVKFIPIKVHFFFLYAGITPWIIYGPTIAKQMGISAGAVGFVYFSSIVFAMLCRFVAGILGDKFHLIKFILISSITVCAVAQMSAMLLPRLPPDTATFFCHPNSTDVNLQLAENAATAEIGQLRTCEMLDDLNSDDFERMCHDWYGNSTAPDGSSSDFCDKLTVEILVTSKKVNAYLSGQISKVQNEYFESLSPQCSTAKNATCFLDCNSDRDSITHALTSLEFWWYFIVYSLFSVTMYMAVTLTDTVCFQQVGDKPEKYGQQRMFGSLGMGLSLLITGFLVDVFSGYDSREKDYTILFVFVTASLILDAIWSGALIKVGAKTKEVFEFKNVRKLLYKVEAIVFLCWAALFGSIEAIAWNYTFWYMEEISTKEQLKWIKSLQGLSGFVGTVLSDGVIFCFSGWIIKKVGITRCMTLVLLVQGFRCYLATFLGSFPLLVVLLVWFDGILYGTAYAIITSYANKVAFPGTETTVQATFSCVYDGIGTSLGSLGGGLLYSYLGGTRLFIYIAVANGCCAVLHVAIHWLISRSQLYSLNE